MRPMAATLGTYEREQLAAVEAGEMPLAVYADWLEEKGDERSVGARWLAEHGKWPRRVCAGWWWTSLEIDASGLPPSLRSRLVLPTEPYRTFGEALFAAMEATILRLHESPIDEQAELLSLATSYHGTYRALTRWLAVRDDKDQRGAHWLVANSRVAEVPLGGGVFWKRAHRNEISLWESEVLPRSRRERRSNR